jgi:hypothetical protein
MPPGVVLGGWLCLIVEALSCTSVVVAAVLVWLPSGYPYIFGVYIGTSVLHLCFPGGTPGIDRWPRTPTCAYSSQLVQISGSFLSTISEVFFIFVFLVAPQALTVGPEPPLVHILPNRCKSLAHFCQPFPLSVHDVLSAIALVLMSCWWSRLSHAAWPFFLSSASHSLISVSWMYRRTLLRVSPVIFFLLIHTLHSWPEMICYGGKFMSFVTSQYCFARLSFSSFSRPYLSSCWVLYHSAWCPSTHWYTASIVGLVLILYAQ